MALLFANNRVSAAQQAQPADRRRRALGHGGQAERSAALPSVGDEREVVGTVGRG